MKTISWYENCDSTKNYGRIRAQDPKNVNDLELLAKIKIVVIQQTSVNPTIIILDITILVCIFYKSTGSSYFFEGLCAYSIILCYYNN